MRPDDKDKLNQCIDILNTTDLGLSLIWLFVWDTIKYKMKDETYEFTMSEDDVWNELVKSVDAGFGFSLEYGAEQLIEDIDTWLTTSGIVKDTMFEE